MLDQQYVLISFCVAAPLTIICVAIRFCFLLLLLLSLFILLLEQPFAYKHLNPHESHASYTTKLTRSPSFFWTALVVVVSVSAALAALAGIRTILRTCLQLYNTFSIITINHHTSLSRF
uniref:Uncharacterized protein n=1 Tax=Hyaloperonospora arabidopsidis (strain Emoy2) TaxID=559515 RepID=M4BW81_HYAAE